MQSIESDLSDLMQLQQVNTRWGMQEASIITPRLISVDQYDTQLNNSCAGEVCWLVAHDMNRKSVPGKWFAVMSLSKHVEMFLQAQAQHDPKGHWPTNPNRPTSACVPNTFERRRIRFVSS